MITLILAISENGKYITEESSPLSAKINQFLNPAYFGEIGTFGTVALIIIGFFIVLITRNKNH